MKNIFRNSAAALAAVLSMCTLSACSSSTASNTVSASADPDKISITTNSYAAYDWANQLLSGIESKADVTYLLSNGVDMHSYNPGTDDIAKISKSDLFVYVGGESDGWADDILADPTNKNMESISMLKAIGNRSVTEEIKDGMDVSDEEKNEDPETDEHVWLSLKNAEVIVEDMEKDLEKLFSSDSDKTVIKNNYEKYNAQLKDLDAQYQKTVDSSNGKTLLFGDRFPFRYMVEDYGLDYYAAFVGCSAETEASFKTIAYLSDKINELGLKHILVIENSDKKIANAIIKNSGSDADVLTINSLQSVNKDDMANGVTYLSTMKDNLDIVSKALETSK